MVCSQDTVTDADFVELGPAIEEIEVSDDIEINSNNNNTENE